MDPYKAYLEELMDTKRVCTIRFRSVEGGVSEVRAHIVDLVSEGDRDIVETDAGFSIGLDKILEVNGRVKEDYC